jgi:probable rRNA maturation factor
MQNHDVIPHVKLCVMTESRPRIHSPRRAGGDGVPEVFCSDEQSGSVIDLPRWRDLAIAALLHEGVHGACELSVFFVDEATMADLNTEHMGKVGPTDVLAFPLDAADMVDQQGPGALTRGPARPQPDSDDVPTLLGDVILCPIVAERQAPTHAGSFDDEVALLLVHGILHVLGFDHHDDETKTIMRARELAILTTHHWAGPAPAEFRQEQDE